MVEYVGQPQYTLAPAFLCPFGWPTEPSYPIDVEASITNTDGGSSTKQSERSNPTSHLRKTWTYLFGSEESKADEEDINRIYLEALYLPDSYATPHQSPLVALTERLKTISHEYPAKDSVDFFESFLISEESLAKKWGSSLARWLDHFLTEDRNQDPFPEADENVDEMFQVNELEAIKAVVAYRKQELSPQACASEDPRLDGRPDGSDPHSKQQQIKPDHNKETFTRSETTKQWIETWSAREAQLQILFLLEIILVTNQSSDQGSQILTHHSQLLSSPRKSRRRPSEAQPLGQSDAVTDLEQLLEGLIDRLAMWQLLSDLQLLGPKTSDQPPHNHDLDDAQRFWTDVVEEYYTDSMPLLNSSFRPKLFPTSIYEPQASSLVPTQFNSAARPTRNLLSSVTRTPNLKKLERRALKQAERNQQRAKADLSPTLVSPARAKRQKLAKKASMSESQLALTHRPAVSSRALFKRREVSMTHLSLKAPKQPIHRASSSSSMALNNVTRGVWGQVTKRMPGELQGACKRKQSSPKKIVDSKLLSRTEVLATPSKAIKTYVVPGLGPGHVLVPDTPQHIRVGLGITES